jgi:aminoglycoside 6-adenylyltransferase
VVDAVSERIRRWAMGHAGLRAVLLTGSRGARRWVDALSDHDVVLYTTDVAPWLESDRWPGELGTVLVRLPPARQSAISEPERRLVVYDDGSKVDFTVLPAAALREAAGAGRLPPELDAGYVVLLDKDGLTAGLGAPSGRAFVPQPPGQEEFADLVEEFWWESVYVAKHLRRQELLPAKYSLECVMKLDLLRRLLDWRAAIDEGWAAPHGDLGRGLRTRLQPELWSALEETFVGADQEENWRALWRTTDLFRRVASEVAARLDLSYPGALDEGVTRHLRRIHDLTTLGGERPTSATRAT